MARQISRIRMNDKQNVRYWTEALGSSKDELAAAVAQVGNSTDAYGVRFADIGHGTFRLGDTKELSRWRGRLPKLA
jgi:hypothetical protein